MNTCATPQISAMTENSYSSRTRVTVTWTRPQKRPNVRNRADVPRPEGAARATTSS